MLYRFGALVRSKAWCLRRPSRSWLCGPALSRHLRMAVGRCFAATSPCSVFFGLQAARSSLCCLCGGGRRRSRPVARRIRGGGGATEDAPINATPATMKTLRCNRRREKPKRRFGRKDPTRSIRFHGFFAAVGEFAAELGQASAYYFSPLAIFGLYGRRKQTKTWAKLFPAIVIGVHVVATFVVAWRGRIPFEPAPVLRYSRPCLGGVGHFKFAALLDARLKRVGRSPLRTAAAVVSAVSIVCFLSISQPAHTAQTRSSSGRRLALDRRGCPRRRAGTTWFTALTTGRTTYRFDRFVASAARSGPVVRAVGTGRPGKPKARAARDCARCWATRPGRRAVRRSSSPTGARRLSVRPAGRRWFVTLLITAQQETSSHARDNVRAFVAAAAESFQPAGPVFEFGSFVVPGRNTSAICVRSFRVGSIPAATCVQDPESIAWKISAG